MDDVSRRVSELDDIVYDGQSRPATLADIAREFVRVMSAIDFRGTPDIDAEVISPAEADNAVSHSQALSDLATLAPWLNEGPSAGDVCEQRWIATQRPPWKAPRVSVPTPDAFVAVTDLQTDQLARRPVPAGLFTSSAAHGYSGMWRTFLELNSPNILWGKPWRIWRLVLPASVRVSQIESALDWARLVERHPLTAGPWVQPDWRSVADEFDAIHLSPRAILTIEGLAVESAAGPIRPTYFDVESTFWLKWSFTSVEEVDRPPPERGGGEEHSSRTR